MLATYLREDTEVQVAANKLKGIYLVSLQYFIDIKHYKCIN